MPTFPYSYPAIIAALFALITPALAGVGCSGGGGSSPEAAPAPPAASATAPTKGTRGGVTYDPAAPLNAEVKPTYDEKTPPSLSYTYAVRFSGGDGATVPAVLSVPVAAAKTKSPCVILLHGLGGSKSDPLMFVVGAALARKGYVTLSVDVAGHGERPKINGKAVSDLNLGEMRTLAGQTEIDLRRAVDFAVSRPEVDPRRIGFLGVSLGSILGGVFVGDDPRVKAAAFWAGGGDWGKLITTSQHAFAQKFRQSGETDAARIAETMRDVDPLYSIASAAPRPLLFINGDKDNIVPTICTDELVAAAKDPKKRVTLSGGHIPDVTLLLNESLTWLDANLK